MIINHVDTTSMARRLVVLLLVSSPLGLHKAVEGALPLPAIPGSMGPMFCMENPHSVVLPNRHEQSPFVAGKYHQHGGFSMAMLVYRSVRH